MAEPDSDPIRTEYARRQARSNRLTARALFAHWGALPAEAEPEPVKLADGTVYDGTGPRPTARDIVEQTKD